MKGRGGDGSYLPPTLSSKYPAPTNLLSQALSQKCLQPGVSMASVASRHGINANLVLKWIPAYRDSQAPAVQVPDALTPEQMERRRLALQENNWPT
ncbi:transposase [Pseudomonas silesiensis]|uniref:transposase n=1 Tax=Pseudomonas silesiensis TaxID=1853130 RepID=UPI003BB566E8